MENSVRVNIRPKKVCFNCDSCGEEMKLEKNFGVKPRGELKKSYRVRRFTCDLCGISKTIFADGFKDEHFYDAKDWMYSEQFNIKQNGRREERRQDSTDE